MVRGGGGGGAFLLGGVVVVVTVPSTPSMVVVCLVPGLTETRRMVSGLAGGTGEWEGERPDSPTCVGEREGKVNKKNLGYIGVEDQNVKSAK